MILNGFKISIAAIVSICLAELFHLEFAIQAGVVAILSIMPTKKATLRAALDRTLAYIVALMIAALSFYTIGFNSMGFFIYLFFYILACEIYGWRSSITMNAVIISHFLSFGNMELAALINETAIFVIGIGAAFIANLHLKKDEDYIEVLKNRADNQIREILQRMAHHILIEDKSDYGYDCFKKLSLIILEAEKMAALNYENQIRTNDTYDIKYISMRMEQQYILQQMYKLVRAIQTTPKTAQMILDARAKYPNSSLADLYDELTMPSDLRRAHQLNDKAVMEAYGFNVKTTTESDCVAKLMEMYKEIIKED